MTPIRAPLLTAADSPPRGWSPDVWRFCYTAKVAVLRLPRDSAEGRLLDGLERYAKLSGRGQTASGAWWETVLNLTRAVVAAIGDEPTALLFAPWTQAPADQGFRPVGSP